jgi:hypothetical protein
VALPRLLFTVTQNKARERRSLKYIRLAAHLAAQSTSVTQLRMSLDEIESVVGEPLPDNARLASWWRNDGRRMHSRAWLTAGWSVDRMETDQEAVLFVRTPD